MKSLSRYLDSEYAPMPSYDTVGKALPDPQLVKYNDKTDPQKKCISHVF